MSAGEKVTEDEIDELMKEGDKNNDGKLDFDGVYNYQNDMEWIKFWLKDLFSFYYVN